MLIKRSVRIRHATALWRVIKSTAVNAAKTQKTSWKFRASADTLAVPSQSKFGHESEAGPYSVKPS